jgi:ferredoxin
VLSSSHGQNIYKCIKSVHYFAVLVPDKENKMSSEKARFQVVADRSRCCGYGLCAAICPSIYKLDADGLVYLDDKIVPPELEEEAREGAAACPAEAIWLEDITAEDGEA